MRFSIVTPTYKRPERLARALLSLQAQTYKDWEMIIINDSPFDPAYTEFAAHIDDPRIRFKQNRVNSGVNFSRNEGLDLISADSKWVIFLDDDDYLAPDALQTFADLIQARPFASWFITNRALKTGIPLTHAPKSDKEYSYAWDYLISKKIRGDATHCINTEALHKIRFSQHVKQGEEWFFYYQLGLKHKLFYHDHNSTISEGYEASGLNFRKRSRWERLETISILFYEGISKGFAFNGSFLLYIVARLVLLLRP